MTGLLGRLTAANESKRVHAAEVDRRSRSRRSPVDVPRPDRLDPFLADIELRTAYRSLVDGDFARLERFLDISAKSWMFGPIITGDIVGLEPVVFERWVEFTGSPRSRVFSAQVLIRDAFAARRRDLDRAGDGAVVAGARPVGVGGGQDGPDAMVDGFLSEVDERFVTRLSAAEEILYETIGERPAMADAWIALLVSGRGLQVDLEELRERFENAHSRAPFRPDACRQYLQGLTKKWGGSSVATFDCARWIEDETPDGSPAREALPMAHIEKGLLEQGAAGLATYLVQPDVVAELATGLLRFLQAIPSPAPTEALGVLNAYALALTVDSRATARLMIETLARIDNRPTEWPWSIYADDVADVFSEIQADQLRFASRY